MISLEEIYIISKSLIPLIIKYKLSIVKIILKTKYFKKKNRYLLKNGKISLPFYINNHESGSFFI